MRRPHPVIARLVQERAKAGMSKSRLARLLYLDPSTVREREKGLHEPVNLAHLDEWAAVFGLQLALVPIKKKQAGEAP